MKFNHIILTAALAALTACGGQERNIALMRSTTASSSRDYCYTAQLATDGIISEAEPALIDFFINGEKPDKRTIEQVVDHKDGRGVDVSGRSFTFGISSRVCPVLADSIIVRCWFTGDEEALKTASATVRMKYKASGDEDWNVLLEKSGRDLLTREGAKYPCFSVTAKSGSPLEITDYEFYADCEAVEEWTIREVWFYRDGQLLELRRSANFNSCWISDTVSDEWICVDLGKTSCIGRIEADWLNAPVAGKVLLSKDGSKWNEKASLSEGMDADGHQTLDICGRARFVKLQLDSSVDGNNFALKELYVFGHNNLKARETGWKLCRASEKDRPEAWVSATVPGTVLASYVDNGAVPDPYFGDNNRQISESYFLSDFIYRGVLDFHRSGDGKVWLNFDGINWKADVSLNGEALGSIAGAFTTARFDVSDIVKEGKNEVEAYIHTPAHPGVAKFNTEDYDAPNGGLLGTDNPTFHASIGWDWIPEIHDRNIGLWNDVYFSESALARLEDPYISTVLREDGSAEVTLSATVVNYGDTETSGTWTAQLKDASARCFGTSAAATVPAGGSASVCGSFVIENPALWWPNGYGEQNLCDVEMGFCEDKLNFTTGLRQMTYDVVNGKLIFFVNGRRFVGNGGNWGFSEATLRYRAREYDIAVGLHKEQNFTMIRNWVCQTGDEEFYDACDKYGIMVWQDFWLANPGDGPEPEDEEMFMQNADNFLKRIRKHPCIALYCGRNEGVPPESLNKALGELTSRLDPGVFYIPDSSHGYVGGNGRYNRWPALDYFGKWEDPAKSHLWGQDRIHSERGMPNVPEYESLVKFIPEDHLWPQDYMWAAHDWTRRSAQGIVSFNDAVESMFGMPDNAERFCELAQWVNYDGYRAIFESRGEGRNGLLLWMSHSAWPTTVWCTYDYWFDPTAAFFGCKKACEPIHIQWNPLTEKVEVVNVSAGDRSGLTARAQVLDMYGKCVYENEMTLDSREDSMVECFELAVPENDDPIDVNAPVYYFRLSLTDESGIVSENTYVEGSQVDNFKALLELPKASLKTRWNGSELMIENVSETPALMIHISARNASDGERVLPVKYSDNYFHLMPGESRAISISAWEDDVRIRPEVRGFNL